MRSLPVRALRSAVALLALAGLALALPTGADAAGTGFTVTVAARTCPSYTAITANRARNNIQESLKDLGADTTYRAGQPIDPAVEQADQPTCTPLPNWTFTLGSGYRSRAVSGPWGSLSIVTSPFASPAITTRASTPLLNAQGQDTGRSLAGAVTVELTQQQLDLAARSNALWLQGGTPADPILNVPYPGQYGFGALRCAIDNLNGDNVEWISFPQGATHVFCYAYYVQPPPTSGTIIVRKQVDAPAGTPKETFPFAGNVSFTPDGSFALAAGPGSPGTQTFYRAAGGSPWTFREQVPSGWTLTGLSCASQNGTSTATTSVATGAASVQLGAGDVMACTYTDTLTPPPAGLLLRKVSTGGVGRFDFAVTGDGGTTTATATTKTEGLAAAATPGPMSLAAGDYTVRESLPKTDAGTWRLRGAECSGAGESGQQPLRVSLTAGAGTVCTFTNAFTPNGTIRLHKQTLGGVGTVGFVISPVGHAPSIQLDQTATTTREGDPVLATGDDTSTLPLGRYVIQETTPTETADGAWSLAAIVCNGEDVPSEQGRIQVTLTAAEPDLSCTYTNRFTPGGAEPNPPGPGPGPDPKPGPDPTPQSELVVTKRATPTTIDLGQLAHYTITVTNRGPAAATEVSLAEQRQLHADLVSLHTTRGTCATGAPPTCSLGTLRAGQRAVITVTTRPDRAGVFRNRVAVSTATDEASIGTNVATAELVVRSGGVSPAFTG